MAVLEVETLADLVPEVAARYGGKPAVVCDGRTLTYAELDDLTRRAAVRLKRLDVERGDRVTLFAPNSCEWIVSYYASARAGAVCNPINVMLTPAEVAFIMRDCGSTVVIASVERGETLLSHDIAKTVILFGSGEPPGTFSFERLIAHSEPVAPDPAPGSRDSLSAILYTSGTTGHPKGAMLSHRALIHNARMTAEMHKRSEADVIVTALPLPHVYGAAVLNSALLSGATLVLLERFTEDSVLDAIATHRATMFEGVPTMYMYLLNHPAFNASDLSSLTRCTVGGQTMPVAKMEEVERRFGCKLIELWGMTELGGLGTTHNSDSRGPLGSIGVALPGIDCRIAALDDAAVTLPAESVGELMVRGPVVMDGYFGNPEATRETIEPDGWLHTGDLARMDAKGYIFVVDRKKDMIITAGYNVYPAEIERVLAQHPAVAMVAVGKQPDDLKGEIAKAYIVLKRGQGANPESLATFCRAHLAAYKVPRAFQFVDDLPKTSTGKILRRRLGALDVQAASTG